MIIINKEKIKKEIINNLNGILPIDPIELKKGKYKGIFMDKYKGITYLFTGSYQGKYKLIDLLEDFLKDKNLSYEEFIQ
ncbi:hypothetical protein [Clostridium sp. SM-530-WT-3G]|uniref:hypothetical protein n=1 Tax=Clostridium sp. SM-530-WT-3G TaxID=2725303 RepID=UPI00145EC0D3|nr:hypothetical protein [Clostridium sp. SM-530-WT-3G]NME83753.1 hypothetical protein [Clostridium sp. SM-530-WT-3G]